MKDTLIKIGLSPEEVELYLSLLEKGAQSAAQLASSTSVKRTYVYRVASSLANKGLVTEAKHGRATVFEPNSPDHLLSLAEAKKIEAEQAQTSLEGVLSSLASKYRAIEAKPVVTYFEGPEGVKKVYRDTLTENGTILALVQTSKVDNEIYEWVTTKYAKNRIKAGIPVRAVVASGQKTKEYIGKNEAELRETKVIQNDKYPFEHEINIYGDKIAIINHRSGTKLMGIIIDNEIIAKTFRSWFEITWDQTKS
ncbi:hypothetical protein C4564_04900 [Candidatus Microgenomates bacterium]|nr:MAG: hypothetical protein C4564_04900 [Candidatus Microgenomates bacterium]